mmetsp:Transcript_2043/g.4555  ORF Transcript_2043/g.4555 Transcript_2043/m.4555 type:complete len:182 (+) Transcript_2043:1639-2184(+)
MQLRSVHLGHALHANLIIPDTAKDRPASFRRISNIPDSGAIGTRPNLVGDCLPKGSFIKHAGNIRTEQQTNECNAKVDVNAANDLRPVRRRYKIAQSSSGQSDHGKVNAIEFSPPFLQTKYIQRGNNIRRETQRNEHPRALVVLRCTRYGEELSLACVAIGTNKGRVFAFAGIVMDAGSVG